MARVVDQNIPSEYADLFGQYMDPARPNTSCQLKKHVDGRKMTQTLRTVMQAFREGGRMWSTKTKPQRAPWEIAGEALGMNGRALFMKEWLNGVFSVGPYTIGKSIIVGWGSTSGAYVTSKVGLWGDVPLISLKVKYQIGYSIVGGEAAIQ